MAVTEYGQRPASYALSALEDRFEVIKDIGDGSFGSVALARVRANGSSVARRNTMVRCYSLSTRSLLLTCPQVAIKTMKKSFDSFAPCLELREVIFLRTLPTHAHLVPALDIFLDPYSKKLHICMEYMDGNLYQLMKAREHKCMDAKSVKSILYQILSGLDHIHAHHFFHRDIKPENILVSTSAPQDSQSAFSRYSALVTPPSTPPTYSIKIADFGLARETHSKLPYTTYVSTRWYRAPEVLLRAGEYSAPVDIWAIGAMAVEIATLKPLFPGGNEVDQVWRVCEIMGSPGNWYTKSGSRVGGGEWRDGTKLAQKLGFSFPKVIHYITWTWNLC
jgi:meiosis induction protein kinase IME2/SME1